MELIKKEKNWFLSKEGSNFFATLSSLEERTIFIYSYLKLTVNESFEINNTLFKIAFFFADMLCTSSKPYGNYPEILTAQANPFLAYLENADKFYSNEIIYMIFTAILEEKVNTANNNEWIYNNKLLTSENLLEKLGKKGIEYLPEHSMFMVDPDAYKLQDENKLLQIALVWMFLK